MKLYNCMVVDDQEESIDLIKDHIQQVPQLALIFASTKPIEALAFLDKTKPDIIFLDIQMPEFTGIDLVENMKERWGLNIPRIVLTTGHIDYTLNGYELGVSDYILKPVTFKRFKKSVDRIINDLEKTVPETNTPDFFFADVDGKKLKINFNDIIYVEGARNYIVIVTNEKKHILYKSMKAIAEILPADNFIRIHKSHFISIDKIVAMQANKLIVNVKGKEVRLPIGITYRNEVAKALNV